MQGAIQSLAGPAAGRDRRGHCLLLVEQKVALVWVQGAEKLTVKQSVKEEVVEHLGQWPADQRQAQHLSRGKELGYHPPHLRNSHHSQQLCTCCIFFHR